MSVLNKFDKFLGFPVWDVVEAASKHGLSSFIRKSVDAGLVRFNKQNPDKPVLCLEVEDIS